MTNIKNCQYYFELSKFSLRFRENFESSKFLLLERR